MQAASLSYATDTRFIAIFRDAVAGKVPLEQRRKELPKFGQETFIRR
jgi:hypothetical protein